MSRYKELLSNKKFMSGLYAVTLITALLLLVLAVKGPEERGKLIADEKGNIVGIDRNSLKTSERYDLGIEVEDEGETITRDVTLTLRSQGEAAGGIGDAGDDREAEIDNEIEVLITSIEYSKEKRIELPAQLQDGTKVTWKSAQKKRGSPLLLIIPALYLSLVILLAADSLTGDRTAAEERRSILKGLPRFCNQLFLMMNAGLILSDAFDTITERYSEYRPEVLSTFEKELADLRDATCGHRISTAHVISEYAVKHDVKELIRIAAILTENEKRGSDVVESLERESRYLWDERKIVAKECGKAIDTKMSYPLGLLLILLIVITMAPALLNI